MTTVQVCNPITKKKFSHRKIWLWFEMIVELLVITFSLALTVVHTLFPAVFSYIVKFPIPICWLPKLVFGCRTLCRHSVDWRYRMIDDELLSFHKQSWLLKTIQESDTGN